MLKELRNVLLAGVIATSAAGEMSAFNPKNGAVTPKQDTDNSSQYCPEMPLGGKRQVIAGRTVFVPTDVEKEMKRACLADPNLASSR